MIFRGPRVMDMDLWFAVTQELQLVDVILDGEKLPWDGEAFKLTENGDLIIPGAKIPKGKSFTLQTKVGWHMDWWFLAYFNRKIL